MVYWLSTLFRRRRRDADLDAELAFHIEALEAEHRGRGLSAEEANLAARRDMGGILQAKEAWRDQAGLPAVEALVRDVRFGLRTLARTPGVTAAIVAALAIGIGANTAMFTVVDRVLLTPLLYPEPNALVTVTHRMPGRDAGTEIPSAPYLYFTYSEANRSFEGVGLWRAGTASVTGIDRPEQVQALAVTHEILSMLRVPPIVGRTFSSQDDSPGSPPTVILAHGYWQRRFGGDPSAVGRRVMVDGQAREVIGVMPAAFRFLDQRIDIVYPFQLERSQVALGRYTFQGLARLKPGMTLAEATADLARLVPVAIERFPPPAGYTRAQFAGRLVTPQLTPLKQAVVGDIGAMLWILMGALVLVLLIAAANVANLLLLRADGRQQELAIRAALGAGWTRIAFSLLAESVMLGLLGGAAALIVAGAALQALRALGPANLPRLEEVAIDPLVLLFTLAVSLVAGIGIGLLPVLKYARPQLPTSLGAGGRTMSDGRERHRTRRALVIVQVAIALVLLVCSGLMIRTFQRLSRVDPGFTRPEAVEMVHLDVNGQDPERTTRMQNTIVDRIASVSGVGSVAFADVQPLADNTGSDTVLTVEGKIYGEGEPRPLRRFEFISPGVFRTLGTPLLAGRDLTWTDLYEKRLVALVSETLARDEWGSAGAALRRRVRASPADPWREIVGVAGDLRDNGVSRPAPPTVYFPALMDHFWGAERLSFGSCTLLVRSARAGNESLVREIETAVWAVAPDVPVAQVRTLEDVYRRSLGRTSFALTMLAVAGVMGLVLGFIGVYGVIAYGVAQRSRETGIRLALGAQAGKLKRMFVLDGLTMSVIGVAAGLGAAATVTRLMSALLYGVRPFDPLTYAAVTAVVLLVAALAAYVPAQRAIRGNPADALRNA